MERAETGGGPSREGEELRLARVEAARLRLRAHLDAEAAAPRDGADAAVAVSLRCLVDRLGEP